MLKPRAKIRDVLFILIGERMVLILVKEGMQHANR